MKKSPSTNPPKPGTDTTPFPWLVRVSEKFTYNLRLARVFMVNITIVTIVLWLAILVRLWLARMFLWFL